MGVIVIHPGEHLAEELETLHMSAAELARKIDVPTNRVTQILSKVKGLGDIPVLGKLFRSRSTEKSTDELLVVVTPRFVRPLAPGENAALPDTVVPFLPTVAELTSCAHGGWDGEPDQPSERHQFCQFIFRHGGCSASQHFDASQADLLTIRCQTADRA